MAPCVASLRHRILLESTPHAPAQFPLLAAEGFVRRRNSWIQQSRRKLSDLRARVKRSDEQFITFFLADELNRFASLRMIAGV
jgi:hypothetical protein